MVVSKPVAQSFVPDATESGPWSVASGAPQPQLVPVVYNPPLSASKSDIYGVATSALGKADTESLPDSPAV